MTMTTTATRGLTPDLRLRQAPHARQTWKIHRAQHRDAADIKALFRKLHMFNAALDPRFALSDHWEAHFDTTMQRALCGDDAICFIAREAGSGLPCGFALAATHHDSGMWRYHDWVEVEALYVEDTWRGSGLAEILLGRASEWADSLGQSVVQLYVTASNERAIRFYRRNGFRVTQEIMRKALT
jgi:ribosomal protein S18 acetylase RimI-like enzyme